MTMINYFSLYGSKIPQKPFFTKNDTRFVLSYYRDYGCVIMRFIPPIRVVVFLSRGIVKKFSSRWT